jgi:hypothetical protein
MDRWVPGEDDDIPEIGRFDLFVRNDGTIEELYKQIDEHVVPFVEQFVFQFKEE